MCCTFLVNPHVEVINSMLSQQKRKRRDAGSQCNGTGSPKRHRESVLRLSGENGREGGTILTHICLEERGEDGREGGPALTHICLEESGEDGDLENLDHSIVQFTVGTDDPTDVLVPIISPNLEPGAFIGTPRHSLSPSQDNTTKTSPSEPSEYTNTGCILLLKLGLNLFMRKQETVAQVVRYHFEGCVLEPLYQ